MAIVVIVTLAIMLFSLRKQSNIITLPKVFLGYWLFLSVFYVLTYGIILDSVFFVILIGCLGFYIGSQFAHSRHGFGASTIESNAVSISKRYNLYILAYLVVFITNIFLALISYQWYQMGYSWDTIRTFFLEGEGFPTQLRLFEVGFVIPCNYISGVVFSIALFYTEKTKKRTILLFLTSGSLLLFGIASQGRFVFLYFLTVIFIAAKNTKTNMKVISAYKKPLLLALFVIYFISVYRQYNAGASNPFISAITGIVGYALLPVDLMTYYLPKIDKNDILGYGFVFVNGFLNIVENITGLLDIHIIDKNNALIQTIDSFSDAVEVRGGNTNSFVSGFTYFYLDFKNMGVFLWSLIYGLICSFLESRKFRSMLYYSIYLFFWVILAMFPVRWGFQQMSVCIAIIYLIYFYKKI